MSRLGSNKGADLFWAHAAAFGALWGAVEITLGSFLHSLRFPFCGVLLTALGVAILAAQRQLLPARGVSLATAAVAALCKSISPGGIILGPMFGIMIEGLIVELFFLAVPRSLMAALVAGVFCACWSAAQQLVTQYLYYGQDLVELYLAAVRLAGDWLGLSAGAGWTALFAFAALLSIIGAAGGCLGWRLGRDARQSIEDGRQLRAPDAA